MLKVLGCESPVANPVDYMAQVTADAGVGIALIDFQEGHFVIDLNGLDNGGDPNHVNVRVNWGQGEEVFPHFDVSNGVESALLRWEEAEELADLLMKLKDGGSFSDWEFAWGSDLV